MGNSSVARPRIEPSSPFRWAGSKRKSLATLAAFWRQEYDGYFEPFCGSASLFFRIRPRNGVLSDTNSDLIHAYKVIRQQPQDLHGRVARLPVDAPTYYRLRSVDPNRLDDLERASRFFYLNRFCFNGLYRSNTKGQFNVPYGGLKSGTIPTEQQLVAFSELLKQADLHCEDFESALARARKGDFVYLDPPYHLQAHRTFRQYSADAFDFGALWRLRQCLEQLAARRIAFLVSYADSAEGKFLARGFKTRRVVVGRNIAGFAAKRRRYTELLVYPAFVSLPKNVRLDS